MYPDRLAVLLFFVFALLLGCASNEERIGVPEWELSIAGRPREAVTLPGRFSDRIGPEHAGFRLTTTLALPHAWRGREVTFVIPFSQGPLELWVAGEKIRALDDAWVEGYRGAPSYRWVLPERLTVQAALSLELRARHTWERSAWFDAQPLVTTDPSGGLHAYAVRVLVPAAAVLAIGTLLAISVASFSLFVLGRRRKHHARYDHEAWIAFQTFLVCFYLLFVSGMSQGLGPSIEIPLVGTSAVLPMLAVIYFTHGRFNLPPLHWSLLLVGIAYVSMAFLASDPYTGVTSIIGAPAIVIVVVCLIYAVSVYARLAWRPQPAPGATENLVAAATFGTLMSPEVFVWTGISDPVQGVRLVPLGLMVYALVQFVSLMNDHMRALDLSEARGLEVSALNAELRRRVADKGAKLSEALARLSAAAGPPAELVAGDTIDGSYRVCKKVGAGAMGDVYQVSRLADGRALAIKMLKAHADTRVMARFAREAQIAASLQHPNLVQIIDVEFSSAGYMYLVMEYVEGRSLDQLAERNRDVAFGVHVLAQVADALRAMHEAGIAHRDLKPANVLVESGRGELPLIKVSDFGISGMLAEMPGVASALVRSGELDSLGGHVADSRVSDDDVTAIVPSDRSGSNPEGLTRHGEIVGTPAYMAPEITLGTVVDPLACDIFSFGVTAFSLLTGRMPYECSPTLAIIERRPWSVERVSDALPDCPVELAGLVDRCLSIDPNQRPRASELAVELGRFARRGSTAA